MKKFSKKKPLNGYCKPKANSLEKQKEETRDYKHLSSNWLEKLLKMPKEKQQYLFMLYSTQGNKKLVKILHEYCNIDINYVYENDNALTLAARSGDMATVKYLVQKNIDINFVGADGKTALQTFAYKGMVANCRYLLDNDANPNKPGAYNQTPIFDAVINNRTDIVDLLTSYGANLDAKNKEGNTPLMIACQNSQRQESLLRLLNYGADIEQQNRKGEKALHVAIKSGNRHFVDILLKRDCNLDCKDLNGTSALMMAAKYGQKETLRVLLTKGADLTATDNNGKTALDYAKTFNNPGAVDILAKAQKCHDNGQDLSFFGKQNRIENSCVK